jgi:MFS family permease
VVAPYVGRAIGECGGRPILAFSAFLLASGLLSIGISQSVAWYLAAWLLVGVGMGFGLTDAAFSTLGSIYGESARGAITSLTLFAGFASTVCWPLSAYLVAHLGWRGTCFVYAAIQIGVALRANDGETSESLKFSLGAKDNHRGYATQRRED